MRRTRRTTAGVLAIAVATTACGGSDGGGDGSGEPAPTTSGSGDGDGGFVAIVNGTTHATDSDLCMAVSGGTFVVNASGQGPDGSFRMYIESGDAAELDFTSDAFDIDLDASHDGLVITAVDDAVTASAPLADGGSIQISGVCS